jgi:hypothetical protein
VTDVQGHYAFTGLGPGPALVRQVVTPLWAQTVSPVPGELTVTSGLLATDRDFGDVRISLDVDGDGRAGALTDGRLISRYLGGAGDGQLVLGSVLGPAAARALPGTIRAFLDAASALTPSMLDVDGDGAAAASIDGRIILRYVAGTPAAQLLPGIALGPGATRTTAAAIVDFLDDFLPAAVGPLALGVAARSAPAEAPRGGPGGAPEARSPTPPDREVSRPNPLEARAAVAAHGLPDVAGPEVTSRPAWVGATRVETRGVSASTPEGWRKSGQLRTGPGREWVKSFLLDLAGDEPNRGILVVPGEVPLDRVPGVDLVHDSVVKRTGRR